MTLQEAAEYYANNEGYPQSDKTHFTTTYWTQHNIASEAFIAGANYILENGWVSVEEKEPEKDGEYLCCDVGKDTSTIFVSYWDGYSWRYLSSVLQSVTHFMSLPKPPNSK